MTPIQSTTNDKKAPMTLADLEDAEINSSENPTGFVSNAIISVLRTPVYIPQETVNSWTTPEQRAKDLALKGQFTIEVSVFWRRKDGKLYCCPKATLKGLTDSWGLAGGDNIEGIRGMFSTEVTKPAVGTANEKIQLNFSLAAMDRAVIDTIKAPYVAYITDGTERPHDLIIGTSKTTTKEEQYGAATDGATASRNTGAVSAAKKYDTSATQGITPPQ